MQRFTLIAAPLLVATLFAGRALAIAPPAGLDVEEVPIDRVLKNVERNRSSMTEDEYWLAVGRVHLLAYIRDIETLPVLSMRPYALARGQLQGCWPLAPTFWQKLTTRWSDRCEMFPSDLPENAERELPEGALNVWRKANDHLGAARKAYEKLRSLDPENMRARLALAYVYDRSGNLDDARTELRFILDAELQLSANTILPYSSYLPNTPEYDGRYWDRRIVTAEAVEHLKLITKEPSDLARINALESKFGDVMPPRLYPITPILIPLKAAKTIAPFINPAAEVAFDFTGQGLPLEGGWITKDAAWLVWDPHRKQKITSGFQLFGSVTWLTPWDNGYLALGTLDDNGDGKIAGAELEGLALWHDVNGNGISDRNEVKSVKDWNIVALSYRHTRLNKEVWASAAGVTFATGETRPTYDWNIRTTLIVANAERAL